MGNEFWVSPGTSEGIRVARGAAGLAQAGVALHPARRDYFEAVDWADRLGWDDARGGVRVEFLDQYEGMGKRKSLMHRLKKHLNPISEARGQIRFMGKLQKALPPMSPRRAIKMIKDPKLAWRRAAKFNRAITPKPVRKLTTKKNLIKYGPYLAAVAQVLNVIIPGLGIAVGLAITAGVAAAKIAQSKQQIHKLKQADKVADQKAVAAYDMSQGYLEEKYNVPRETFVKMSTDDKINFLSVAVDDAKREGTVAGKIEAAAAPAIGISAIGLLALFLL